MITLTALVIGDVVSLKWNWPKGTKKPLSLDRAAEGSDFWQSLKGDIRNAGYFQDQPQQGKWRYRMAWLTSARSNVATVTLLPTDAALPTPTNCRGSNQTQTSALVSWDYPATQTGVTGFRVEYKLTGSTVWQVFGTTQPATARSVTVTGLTSDGDGVSYDFAVTALA
jgi:hypothetical protein